MKISVGNLHYHYASKWEVVKSLLDRFNKAFDKLAEELEEIDLKSFSNYQRIIIKTFELIHQYRFFFNDRLTLLRKVPEMEETFRQLIHGRENEFYVFLDRLDEEGLLREDLPREQYSILFKQIVILYNSWGSHTSLFQMSSVSDMIIPGYFAEIVAAIWVPYFSDKGLERFGLV